jgi:hypothetical protein
LKVAFTRIGSALSGPSGGRRDRIPIAFRDPDVEELRRIDDAGQLLSPGQTL